MTDQLYITDDGQIGSQPLTWDGQPLYSPETVREGLFDAGAFEQQPGQITMGCDHPKDAGGVCGTPGCPMFEEVPMLDCDHGYES